MNRTQTIIKNAPRTRFQHDVNALLSQDNPDAHAMMTAFGNRSESFSALRDEVVDHYFSELPTHPNACADAMSHLVNSVVSTIKQSLVHTDTMPSPRHN